MDGISATEEEKQRRAIHLRLNSRAGFAHPCCAHNKGVARSDKRARFAWLRVVKPLKVAFGLV